MFWRTASGSRPTSISRHLRAARGRLEQAAEHANGGGLARAVRSEKAEDFALSDFEIDPVDGHKIAEPLDQVLHHD